MTLSWSILKHPHIPVITNVLLQYRLITAYTILLIKFLSVELMQTALAWTVLYCIIWIISMWLHIKLYIRERSWLHSTGQRFKQFSDGSLIVIQQQEGNTVGCCYPGHMGIVCHWMQLQAQHHTIKKIYIFTLAYLYKLLIWKWDLKNIVT